MTQFTTKILEYIAAYFGILNLMTFENIIVKNNSCVTFKLPLLKKNKNMRITYREESVLDTFLNETNEPISKTIVWIIF